MKKLFTLLVASAISVAAFSQEEVFCVDKFWYEILPDNANTVAIRQYDESKNIPETLTIPAEVVYPADNKTYRVVGIKRDVFGMCNGIRTIVFPETLEWIEEYAFSSINSLQGTITMPSGLKKLDISAFCGTFVSKLILPENIEEFNCDASDSWIQDSGVEVEFNISDIEQWCQNEIKGYKPIVVGRDEYDPFTVYRMNVSMTYRGKTLTNLTLPMGVESIKPYAFACVSTLESVILSSDITEIGNGAFAGTDISECILPQSITKIGDYAFCSCPNLNITLTDNIKTIGDYAFYDCEMISEIAFPSSVEKIGASAFKGCIDLSEVTFAEGLKEIGDNAFNLCKRIKSVEFPSTLISIGKSAFESIDNLTELKFGNQLRTIGDRAFARSNEYYMDIANRMIRTCTVTFSEGLEQIGQRAFEGWNIRELNLPSTLSTLGAYAFYGSAITSVKIPEAMTVISEGAFAGCEKLATVEMHNGVTEIGQSAFSGTSIFELNLPESVTAIGDYAFTDTKLINVVIPDYVTAIGERAFPTVRYMKIGTGIKSLTKSLAEGCDLLEMAGTTPPTLGSNRLGFEPKLVLVPSNALDSYSKNTRWKDYNIAAINGKSASIYLNEPGTLATEIRIQSGFMPALVTNLKVEGELNDDDFAVIRSNMTSCYDLDLSGITNKVIPANAFTGKSMLLNVALPSGVEEIGDNAFKDCYVMHLNAIPSSLVRIGNSAFENCYSMDNDLVFPKSLNEIGLSAFQNCQSIKSVDMSACHNINFAAKEYEGYVFSKTNSLKTVKFSPEQRDITSWLMFYFSGVENVELPEGMTTIPLGAFWGCSYLKNITIPSTVNKIETEAFYLSGLENIEISSAINHIGRDAFKGSSLVYADIADGITNISEGTFSDCPDLLVVNLPSTLTTLNDRALNSPWLTAINSPSVNPAATNGHPFESVDNYTCALSIPKPSYSKYLLAEYWGAFVDIRNCIDVTIDKGADVTYMDEEDYQDLIEEEENQEPQPANARRRALRVMRANNVASVNRGYGKIFSGASLYRGSDVKTRFFVDLDPSATNFRVEYNGKDITSEIDRTNMSFVTAELTADATLKIYTGLGGIDNVKADTTNEGISGNVYDLTGRVVRTNATDLNGLPAGIYICNGNKIAVK